MIAYVQNRVALRNANINVELIKYEVKDLREKKTYELIWKEVEMLKK